MALAFFVALCLIGTEAAAGSPPAKWSPVAVQVGQTTSGIDITAGHGGSLSGTIVDAETGAPADVGAVAIPVGATGSWVRSQLSGSFTISNLAPKRAKYRVCTLESPDSGESYEFAPRCYPDVAWDEHHVPAGAQVISLSPGEHKDLGTLTIDRTGFIAGRVTSPSGKPLYRVKVTATSVAKPHLRFTSYTGAHPDGTAGNDPSYLLSGVSNSPGGWTVCFDGPTAYTLRQARRSAPGPGYLSQCYRHAATQVRVRPGQTVHKIDGTLNRAHLITGQLRAPSGRPLNGIHVVAYNRAGHEVGNYADERNITDRNGRYRIDGLHATGGINVCAYPEAAHYARQSRCAGGAVWNGRSGDLPPSARNVRVRSNDTTRVDVTLPVGETVSGHVVVTGSGAPAAHMYVYAFTPNGEQWAEDYTDSSGAYALWRLHPSRTGYVLCAVGISDAYTGRPAGDAAPTCWRGTAWTGDTEVLPTSAARLQMRAGQHRRGIDLVAPAAGAITGTVTDSATGDNLAATVSVYDAAGNVIGSNDTSDGHYRIRGLGASATGYAVCETTAFAPTCYRAGS